MLNVISASEPTVTSVGARVTSEIIPELIVELPGATPATSPKFQITCPGESSIKPKALALAFEMLIFALLALPLLV
ncbi:MAG: hypothetical protein HC778_05945 [Chamaesiphon sp. CSU_1_12]|nr:hypothetical protein [Chamaesiphon sp. CSU_1_12]